MRSFDAAFRYEVGGARFGAEGELLAQLTATAFMKVNVERLFASNIDQKLIVYVLVLFDD